MAKCNFGKKGWFWLIVPDGTEGMVWQQKAAGHIYWHTGSRAGILKAILHLLGNTQPPGTFIGGGKCSGTWAREGHFSFKLPDSRIQFSKYRDLYMCAYRDIRAQTYVHIGAHTNKCKLELHSLKILNARKSKPSWVPMWHQKWKVYIWLGAKGFNQNKHNKSII